MSISLPDSRYPFDPVGSLVSNKIQDEQNILTITNYRDFHYIVPKFGPFFESSIVVSIKLQTGEIRPLVKNIDYYCTHHFLAASRACAKDVYGSITILNLQLAGIIITTYQSLGGVWLIDDSSITTILADRLHNPRITTWDSVIDMPMAFPVIDHIWNLSDMVGQSEVIESLNNVTDAILTKLSNTETLHLNNINNPHMVTAAQINAYTKLEVNQFLSEINSRLSVIENKLFTHGI